jgi:hypothetical protein
MLIQKKKKNLWKYEPSGREHQAIEPFITARQHSGHPDAIHRLERLLQTSGKHEFTFCSFFYLDEKISKLSKFFSLFLLTLDYV